MKGSIRLQPILIAVMLAGFMMPVHGSNQALILEGFLPYQWDDPGHRWRGSGNSVWGDPFLAYELLCSQSRHKMPLGQMDHGQIHMLWANGSDFDSTKQSSLRYNSWFMLGRHSITDDSASRSKIQMHIDTIASRMNPNGNDTLFVYFDGHGGARGGRGYLGIQPIDSQFVNGSGWWYFGDTSSGRLYDSTFAIMMSAVPTKHKIYVMQPCASWCFIDDLALEDSLAIILASTSDTGSSYLCDDMMYHRGANQTENESLYNPPSIRYRRTQWHGEFSFHVMNALRDSGPWPGYQMPWDPPESAGKVTWGSVFAYADSMDSPVLDRPSAYPYGQGGGKWVSCPSVPAGPSNKPVKDGGCLTFATIDTTCGGSPWNVFALKGNNTREFYRYDIDANWSTQESIPLFGPYGGKKKNVKKGAALAALCGKVYAVKGNSTNDLFEFDPMRGSGEYKWQAMPTQIPGVPIKEGAGMVGVPGSGVGADTLGHLYLLKGSGTREFLRYNFPNNSWTTLSAAPAGNSGRPFKAGSCIAYDGDNTIYALKGTYDEFFAYDIANDTWRANLPLLPLIGKGGKKKKVKDGALACLGPNAYALKGGNTCEVWCWVRSTKGWRQVTDVPFGTHPFKNGAALAACEGLLYSLKGNGTREFWRYAPSFTDTVHSEFDLVETPPGGNELLVSSGEDVANPRWDPTLTKIAYSRPTNNNYQIRTVQASGVGDTQRTSMSGDCTNPVWSPGAGNRRIAFQYSASNSVYSQIAIVSASGGQVQVRTSDTFDHVNPEWLDSSTVLYARIDSTGYSQIYLVPAQSGTEIALTSSYCDHRLPKPYSTTNIVYLRDTSGFDNVFKLNVNTKQEVALTSSQADHDNLCVSTGGGFAVFQVAGSNGYEQIGKVPFSGGSESVLTDVEYDLDVPSVTSDGTAIHCMKRTGSCGVLAEVDVSTGDVTELTDDVALRDNPNSIIDMIQTPVACYEREDGVYKAVVGDGLRSEDIQSADIFDPSITPGLAVPEPNPAGRGATIRYQINRAGQTTLRAYDLAGKVVRTLVSARQKPGRYVTSWTSRDDRGQRLADGIYFLRLSAQGFETSRKVVVQ